MSWPQYPLEETLESVYCSEFFGEIPESSSIHGLGSDFSFIQSASGRWFPQVASVGSCKLLEESRNAAMAVGAGRAAGLIPQLASAEAFNKVRTTTLPPAKWPHTPLQQFSPHTPNTVGSDQFSTNSNYLLPSRSCQISGSELEMPSLMLPDPQLLNQNFMPPRVLAGTTQIPALDPCSSTVHMGRSVASHQHNSHAILDPSCTQSNLKLTAPGASCKPNTLHMVKFKVEPDEILGVQSMHSHSHQSLCASLNLLSSQKASLTEELHSLNASAGRLETKSPYFSWSHMSTESAAAADEKKAVLQNLDILHPDEHLSTQNSFKRTNKEEIVAAKRIIKKAISSPSRAEREACKAEDFTDCECKDMQAVSIGIKRYGSGRVKKSKRGRAAEVHNLSERRRRDRINERLRALQDLIPTSNKTDKASMLDEAVEYLKMLQLQLQIMSMRTGMIIPPMLITPNMQHLQPLVQMQMEAGIGLGMTDHSTGPFTPYDPSLFEAAQCKLYSSSDALSRLIAACNPYSSFIEPAYNPFSHSPTNAFAIPGYSFGIQ